MDRLSNEMYPHIVERVAKLAPWNVKLAFRLTSKRFLKIVDDDIYRHIKILPRLTRRRSRYPPVPESDIVVSDTDSPNKNYVWPLKELIIADGRTGRELPVLPSPSSKRWSAAFGISQIVDLHGSDEWISGDAESILDTTYGFVDWLRRISSVSVTLAATNIVDLVRITKETENWNAARDWFEDLVVDTPCMTFEDEEPDDDIDLPHSPVLTHIVNIEFDPFYDHLHYRPVTFEANGVKESNAGTVLWVFFLPNEQINIDSSRLKTANDLEESFVWSVLQGFLFIDYVECTLVGLERIPPQLLGLPHDTKSADINNLVSSLIESHLKSAFERGDYDKKLDWYLGFVECRSLDELENDPHFEELLAYQSSWTSRYLKEDEYNRSARDGQTSRDEPEAAHPQDTAEEL